MAESRKIIPIDDWARHPLPTARKVVAVSSRSNFMIREHVMTRNLKCRARTTRSRNSAIDSLSSKQIRKCFERENLKISKQKLTRFAHRYQAACASFGPLVERLWVTENDRGPDHHHGDVRQDVSEPHDAPLQLKNQSKPIKLSCSE